MVKEELVLIGCKRMVRTYPANNNLWNYFSYRRNSIAQHGYSKGGQTIEKDLYFGKIFLCKKGSLGIRTGIHVILGKISRLPEESMLILAKHQVKTHGIVARKDAIANSAYADHHLGRGGG